MRLAPGLERDAIACRRWVDRVEERAWGLGREGGLYSDGTYFLVVALQEALTNALRHGKSADGRGAVEVTLAMEPGEVLAITVRDRGRGFDPSRVPDPLRPECLVKASGRGIFYMRRFVDRVSFSFPCGGGTIVRLEKHLPER